MPKISSCRLTQNTAFYSRTIKLITEDNFSPKLERAVYKVLRFVRLFCENTELGRSYDKISLEEFKRLTNNEIDWTLLVNNIIDTMEDKIPLQSDRQLVVVRGIEYYKRVSRLINETPNHVINNYLGLMAALSLSEFGNDRLFDVFSKTSNLLYNEPIWERCLKQVVNVLPLPTSRLYLEKKRSTPRKQMVIELIKNIVKSFNNTLIVNTWLDNQSKEKAIEKLSKTNYHVAYPRDIFHNPCLDIMSGIRKPIKVITGRYFRSIMQIRELVLYTIWTSLNKNHSRTAHVWLEKATHNFDAVYINTKNAFVITAAVLQPPYFHSQWPPSMKFGALGFTIAHEITHGFDNKGRKLDKYGNYKNWWTDDSERQFIERANCFVRQYTFRDSTSGMQLNGIATLHENIADNGGFRQSYKAYQNYVNLNPEQRYYLSSYTEFTSDQLFFLSFAQTLCSVNHPDMIKNLIRNDVHSLDNYRINIVLGNNFEKFARAFNCKKTAKMNIRQKCKVW